MQNHQVFNYVAFVWPDDNAALIQFLCGESWPFHGSSQVNREQLEHKVSLPDFVNSDVQYFWICTPAAERIGLIKLFDLNDIGDGYPLFDLRI